MLNRSNNNVDIKLDTKKSNRVDNNTDIKLDVVELCRSRGTNNTDGICNILALTAGIINANQYIFLNNRGDTSGANNELDAKLNMGRLNRANDNVQMKHNIHKLDDIDNNINIKLDVDRLIGANNNADIELATGKSNKTNNTDTIYYLL